MTADCNDDSHDDFREEEHQSLIGVVFCKMGFGSQQNRKQEKRTEISQNGQSFLFG